MSFLSNKLPSGSRKAFTSCKMVPLELRRRRIAICRACQLDSFTLFDIVFRYRASLHSRSVKHCKREKDGWLGEVAFLS
uniref:Uncharacterized protein n=1 Tax=Parascaris equorum TaxID=6256 RepID=A0A914RZ25_PAREQ